MVDEGNLREAFAGLLGRVDSHSDDLSSHTCAPGRVHARVAYRQTISDKANADRRAELLDGHQFARVRASETQRVSKQNRTVVKPMDLL